jgi:TIR domain
MTLPLHKRDFDLFLSHAHKDREFVLTLDKWLTEKAGLSVWYDARELGGGALIATDLQKAIERCRGVLLVASEESLNQGWVKSEYNSAIDERSNHEGFRVVTLRLKNASVQNLIRGTSWIDVPDECLDANTALAILNALYPGERRPNPATARDVYISCSWQEDDNASSLAVCRMLVEQGLRLVGDAKDQKGFGEGDRVERIIASCGAFVCIIPYRNSECAVAGEKPYKYFLSEIDSAAQCGLPSLIIADPRVRRKDGLDQDWLRMETGATECPDTIASALKSLWHEWREPPGPHYIFCALDLDSEGAKAKGPIRHLLERVTGMPTIVGNEIHEEPLQTAIIKKVCNAFVVLADITDDNLNTCIEAGMGLAARTNVELITRGEPRRPPFMLRALQMPNYQNELEQIGIVHKIIRPYRRRIINAELKF